LPAFSAGFSLIAAKYLLLELFRIYPT